MKHYLIELPDNVFTIIDEHELKQIQESADEFDGFTGIRIVHEFGSSFYYKVVAMRSAQRQYFKTRSNESLNESKQLEREIDSMIDDMHQTKLKFK